MLEKRFYAVSPQAFTADGTVNGVITIAANACTLFKVKMRVILKATGLPNLELEIKEIDRNDNIQVGPFPNKLGVPGQNTGITARTDVSAYTVALGAVIFADEQKRPSIDNIEIVRATYEEEPTVAVRSIMVDPCGNLVGPNNPLPVSFEGGGLAADVNIHDASGNPYTPANPLPVVIEDANLNVTLGAVRITACDNDPKLGDIHSSVRISDCANDLKINPDGSINVIIEPTPASGAENITVVYNETAIVASGVSTNIINYSVPVGPTLAIDRVLVSGENIARYDILVNGIYIATQRTCFGSDLSRTIEFIGSDGSGYQLNAGDVVTVVVLHTRPYTAIFEATLELIANPAIIPGEHPTYVYHAVTSCVAGTTYSIATYTVLPGRTSTLQRVLVSGENIARYDVYLNAGSIATQRTCFGGDLDGLFEFMGWNGGGVPLNPGDTITVKVLHNRPFTANFEATIEAIEYV